MYVKDSRVYVSIRFIEHSNIYSDIYVLVYCYRVVTNSKA